MNTRLTKQKELSDWSDQAVAFRLEASQVGLVVVAGLPAGGDHQAVLEWDGLSDEYLKLAVNLGVKVLYFEEFRFRLEDIARQIMDQTRKLLARKYDQSPRTPTL